MNLRSHHLADFIAVTYGGHANLAGKERQNVQEINPDAGIAARRGSSAAIQMVKGKSQKGERWNNIPFKETYDNLQKATSEPVS